MQRRAGIQHGGGPGGVGPGLPRIEDPDLRGHVAEQVQQQEVPRPAPGLQGGVLIRGEQHGQVPAAGQELLEAGGEQGSCRVGCAADGPVLLRPEQQPVAVRAEVDVHGHVERHPPAVPQHRGGPLEEADPVHGKGPLEPRGGIVRHQGHHVVLGDFEQPLRRGKGSAAAQLDAGPGVGGRGGGQSRGGGGNQQGVGVEPGGVALRCRQVKAAGGRVHEAAGLDVELAVAVRVAAVGGERQQRQPVRFTRGRAQEAGAVEDPLLALRRGQRVHIQQDVPLRSPAAVAVPAGPAPQSLGVVPGPSRSCSTSRRACPPWRSGRWSPAPPGCCLPARRTPRPPAAPPSGRSAPGPRQAVPRRRSPQARCSRQRVRARCPLRCPRRPGGTVGLGRGSSFSGGHFSIQATSARR